MKILFITLLIVIFSSFSDTNTLTIQDVSEIRWSNDGSKLAIGYYDGSFRIFKSDDMSILFEQPSAGIYISAFGWNSDGTKLAIGYYTRQVEIWDVISKQKLITLDTGDTGNLSLTWIYNDTMLIVGGDGETSAIVFDINNSVWINTYPPIPIFGDVYILNNGSTAVTNRIYEIIFINLINMNIINQVNFENIGQITTYDVSPNQQFIAVGFLDETVRILDAQSLEVSIVLGSSNIENNSGVMDLMFNETGSRLFMINQIGVIQSWDTTTWQIVENVVLNKNILSVDFSPDASQITYAELEQGPQIFIRDLCDFVAPDDPSLLAIFPQADTFGEEAQICLTENATYTLTASLPNITGDITLIGNGSQIVMTGGSRIFNVTATGGLHLKNVTLSGGVADEGGAIYNAGELTLENAILQNHSAVRGGAIYNVGSLVMNGGAIQNNTATEFGGGIYNIGDMQLDGVNIRDNSAPEGSGVYQGG